MKEIDDFSNGESDIYSFITITTSDEHARNLFTYDRSMKNTRYSSPMGVSGGLCLGGQAISFPIFFLSKICLTMW